MEFDDLDLLLGFVLREKRYLRTRETSFSQSQLNEGKRAIKDILKALRTACKNKVDLTDCLSKKTKRAALVSAASKKVRRTATRKQVKLVAENYALFNAVFGKTVKTSNLQLDPHQGDRYYAPKKHDYK